MRELFERIHPSLRDYLYLCEKFRYEKIRLWKIRLNLAHWLMPHTLQTE
mgnify:CR=1 FL=1